MRERRRVFSFWQPKRPLSALTAPELATQATYLLGQCVNYASKEEQETYDLSRRLEKGSELLFLLQEWYNNLTAEHSPLPMASTTTVLCGFGFIRPVTRLRCRSIVGQGS